MDLNKDEPSSIAPTDTLNLDIEKQDDVPSANSDNKDGKGAKQLRTLGIIIAVLLIAVAGIVMAASNYNSQKAEQKAKEAAEVANAQKTVGSGSKVDVEADKLTLQNNRLPEPAGYTDEMATDITVPEPVTIQDRPYTPPEPSYEYVAPEPAGYIEPVQPVAVNLAPIAPVVELFDPEDDAPEVVAVTPAQPIVAGANSSVLVDTLNPKRLAVQNTPAQTELSKNLQGTQTSTAKAVKTGDNSLWLKKGTTLVCVLKTKIDSTYQGFTSCQLTKDVYSSNGKTLILERGSMVFGEQNIQITQGQARVAVLWTRIDTPKGVSINIDSPATGQLGEMGIGARVKSHFGKRFGGAIMLSLIQDSISAATTHLEKDMDSGTTIDNTSSTADSMAQEALKNSINITPTATVNQGALINITVVRDVDFGDIYRLQER